MHRLSLPLLVYLKLRIVTESSPLSGLLSDVTYLKEIKHFPQTIKILSPIEKEQPVINHLKVLRRRRKLQLYVTKYFSVLTDDKLFLYSGDFNCLFWDRLKILKTKQANYTTRSPNTKYWIVSGSRVSHLGDVTIKDQEGRQFLTFYHSFTSK